MRKRSKPAVIYVGRCMTTNRVYVGSSLQGHSRVFAHTRDLEKGKHTNSYLQRSWNKYGSKDFVWHVVEECKPEEILDREQWWIDFLRAADRRYGFNLCNALSTDGHNRIRTHLSATQVEKWRDPEIRRKRLTGIKKLHNDPEWKDRRGAALKAKWQDPEFRKRMLGILAKNVAILNAKMKNEPGFKEHRMRGIQPNKVSGRV